MLLKGAFFLLSITYIGLITEKEAASISDGKISIFNNCSSINVIAGVKFKYKQWRSILETMGDSNVVTGSKVEGHTEKSNSEQDNDEATEKNIEGIKSTGKQGIEVELKKLEEEIKDDEDDSNPHVKKKKSKGEMTSFCPIHYS